VSLRRTGELPIVSSVLPRIVAVLVTHDGAAMLRRTLTAVAAQTQPGIEVIAVDNASEDGTSELLVDLLGPERVLVADVDLGFSAAVDLALDALDAQDARRGRGAPHPDDLLLLLHDDLELERDAVARLVAALEADPGVAIVGPKLRWADDPTRIQSVGATIDLTGRVDDGIDPGELDQGQRDGDRRVLFVPTAGMLVRRRVFEELGRFDPRSHAFREDLDLCWRANIAGHDVEVVPGAVGHHAALAAEHVRAGRVATLGPRYLAERNTLAALLTNYGPERLVFVLPLALVVGIAKVLGFLATRRVGDARATVAAWGWNLANLGGTLRRRRAAQRLRRRRDDELATLFARITPRVQAYLEAVLDRADAVARAEAALDDAATQGDPGGGAEPMVPDDEPVSAGLLRRAAGFVVARPLQTLLPPAAVLLLIGLRSVLTPGVVRGGDLLPFPAGPSMLVRYASAWHDSGATLTALAPSPAQLVLGMLQWVAGDGALRMLLVLAPAIAWIGAMRALAPFLAGTLPRTILALGYVAAPPALAATAEGDLVTVVVMTLIPFVVIAGTTIADASAAVGRVWRRIALVTFLLAGAIAFAPTLVLVLPLILVAGVGHALVAVTDAAGRRTLIVRSVLVATLPLPLLGPWLLTLPDVLAAEWTVPGTSLGGHPAAWVALDPTGRILGVAGLGLLLAGLVGAAVVSVADVGVTLRRAALAMTAVALLLPLVAWWADAAPNSLRHGPLLVVAAAASVGLAALGLEQAPSVLSRHTFGWRQVTVAAATVGVVASTGLGLVDHAVRGTPGLVREEAVPAYLASLGPEAPDRVLVLGDGPDGIVWEIVPATGPDLASFGVRHQPEIDAQLREAMDDLLAGRDPRAAGRLGRLGVGVVLVPEGRSSDALETLLRVQLGLDPLPTLDGLVARVSGSVPGAAVVTGPVASDAVPDPTAAPTAIVAALERRSADRFDGDAGPGGALLTTVPFGEGWRVLVDGVAAPMRSDEGLVTVLDIPAAATLEVVASPSTTRTGLLRGQALWAVLIVSLGARPPAFALRSAQRRSGRTR